MLFPVGPSRSYGVDNWPLALQVMAPGAAAEQVEEAADETHFTCSFETSNFRFFALLLAVFFKPNSTVSVFGACQVEKMRVLEMVMARGSPLTRPLFCEELGAT